MRRKTVPIPILIFIWLAIIGGGFWWWQGRDEEKEVKEVKEKPSLIKESGPASLVPLSLTKEEPKEEVKEESPYLEQIKEATEENISPQTQEEKEEKFKATASVTDQNGEVIKKADFWLIDFKGNEYEYGETSQTGYLEIDITSMPSGEYTLHIEKHGYDSFEKKIQISDREISLGEIKMRKWSKVTAFIIDQHGNPIIEPFWLTDEKDKTYCNRTIGTWCKDTTSTGYLETPPVPNRKYTLEIGVVTQEGCFYKRELQIFGKDINLGQIIIHKKQE